MTELIRAVGRFLNPSIPTASADKFVLKGDNFKLQQRNADKGKRTMRLQRGAQPDNIGARRFIRNAERQDQRKAKAAARLARREGL